MENDELDDARFWWWPEKDGQGRDLADDGKPCWGEESGPRQTQSGSDGSIRAALVPSQSFLTAFESAPEWYEGQGD